MTLPLVQMEGEPFDQGLVHGRALGDQIAHNLAVYYDRFLSEGRLDRDEARARAKRLRPLLEPHPYYAGVLGVASGAGIDPLDLLVLNLRYELLYYQYGIYPVGRPDGCTSFAILPSSSMNGHLLLGQNWDWLPGLKGAVLHTREPDGLETLAFTEAGIIGGKIGLNSAGVGLTINGLMTTVDNWSRPVLPFHVRCFEILRQRRLASSRLVIEGAPRACSANFLIAQAPADAVDIEAAPDALHQLEPLEGRLVHTNHFLAPEQLGVVEPETERRPHTYLRQARMQHLLHATPRVSTDHLERALSDHDGFPDSVCRHENKDDPAEEWCITVTSAIMDLDELSLRLSDGQPCANAYARFSVETRAMLGY